MNFKVWLMRVPLCWHKGCTEVFPPVSAEPIKMETQEEEVKEEHLVGYEKDWENEIKAILESAHTALLIGQGEKEFIIRSINPSGDKLKENSP